MSVQKKIFNSSAINLIVKILILLFIISGVACKSNKRFFYLLSINDVYRINGLYEGKEGGLARIRTFRADLEKKYPDLIFLHAGDFLFPSLLSQKYNGAQMISVMNLLDGKKDARDERFFATFGNHEFEKGKMKDAALLQARINESEFSWLGSNIEFKKDAGQKPVIHSDKIIKTALMTSNGVKVGVFSLTTDVKRPDYVDHFGDPVTIAKKLTADLRKRGAEVVIALTHLKASQDEGILKTLGADGPDLIIGGHEHDQQSHEVNGRYVIKADADAKSAIVAKISLNDNAPPGVSFEFKDMGSCVKPDLLVQKEIDMWSAKFDVEYCKDEKLPAGCTKDKFSFAGNDLVAEEIQIRKYETNFGNWIADQALAAYKNDGAKIAFINSGGIRLNQNILKGTDITRVHIEELFPYKTNLKLIKITGADLQKIVDRSTTDWTGNGWWLQISGFAFTFNPETGKAENLTLLDDKDPQNKKPRRIQPGDELLAVTADFLLDPSGDQDGYTMLNQKNIVPNSKTNELSSLVIGALKQNFSTGIAPKVEGRICNSSKKDRCLTM
jgi:2',3'-cyclic-nucleotide 2'-phosphodiesterase (5'-nucleotidase family)